MTVVKSNKVEEAVQAGDLLRTTARLHNELQLRNFACCDVQSSTQCHILTTLGREGDQTLAALTRSLNIDKAWLSRSTDDLVSRPTKLSTANSLPSPAGSSPVFRQASRSPLWNCWSV
jgi:hypothetical protein